MRVVIQENYEKMCKWAAAYIAAKINAHRGDRPFVLGLPTGSSPLGVYAELARMNNLGEVSFRNVVTFNMDEYLGLPREHDQSYWYFMWSNFFDHIDIPRANVNILDGMAADPEAECAAYEAKIASLGGIETGIKKFGAMLGDYVECGCNSVLNPGTVVGRHSNIYPTACVRGVVPEGSIYKNSGEIVGKTE